jgi:drug/metabolite transporter (DMT)-like permease
MPRLQPARWLVIAAFAAVYLIWGSTYLALRFAIETIPVFLMMGSRFALAGALLMLFARARGAALPTWKEVRNASIVGALLFLINNGILVWAAQHVPSGVLALLVAAVPMWFALIDWLFNGARPTPPVIVGLLLGVGGLALLISPDSFVGGDEWTIPAAIAVVFGTIAWASGSLLSRRVAMPASTLMSTGMQLFSGGMLLMALDVLTGEAQRFSLAQVSTQSALSWMYLFTFGSIIAFSAYTFLLRVTTATRAATYAFVNPVVALFLGWLLGSEVLTERTLLAGGIIVVAVAILILSRGQGKPVVAQTEVAEAGQELKVNS